MEYRLDAIVRDVKIAVGEAPGRDTALSAQERLMLLQVDDIVRLHIEREAAEAVMRAPLHHLENVSAMRGECRWLSDCAGEIPLPPDWLRLIEFRMPDWSRSLTEVSTGQALRQRLGHDAPEWVFTPRRPLLMYGYYNGGVTLRYLGTTQPTATPVSALYAPRPTLWADDTIDIPSAEYPAVIASLAAVVRGIYTDRL